jgi:hypothetical protein
MVTNRCIRNVKSPIFICGANDWQECINYLPSGNGKVQCIYFGNIENKKCYCGAARRKATTERKAKKQEAVI